MYTSELASLIRDKTLITNYDDTDLPTPPSLSISSHIRFFLGDITQGIG